jgi:hypothetical protein
MQRRRSPYAWKAWRDTIIAVVVVIAIGSLASASPSLRAPRGPHESVVVVPTGATEAGGPSGTITPANEPGEEGEPPSNGVDFTACEGLTGLENAICRHEALLAVHPDNHGLQNSLAHLQEIKAEHEANSSEKDGGPSTANGHGHGQSGGSHGNTGGNGHGNVDAGGNGHGNVDAGGNGHGH